jgi:hypothetical protein
MKWEITGTMTDDDEVESSMGGSGVDTAGGRHGIVCNFIAAVTIASTLS